MASCSLISKDVFLYWKIDLKSVWCVHVLVCVNMYVFFLYLRCLWYLSIVNLFQFGAKRWRWKRMREKKTRIRYNISIFSLDKDVISSSYRLISICIWCVYCTLGAYIYVSIGYEIWQYIRSRVRDCKHRWNPKIEKEKRFNIYCERTMRMTLTRYSESSSQIEWLFVKQFAIYHIHRSMPHTH